MTENKHFPKKIENLELALHKTRNLLSITDKILASKTLAVSDDAWLDELIAWADENGIQEYSYVKDYGWIGFPRNKQELLAITVLDLFNNALTELPELIGKLSNLKTLNLMGNSLTKIPESISLLSNLTKLNLHDNRLNELPEFIGKMKNLTSLDISFTHL